MRSPTYAPFASQRKSALQCAANGGNCRCQASRPQHRRQTTRVRNAPVTSACSQAHLPSSLTSSRAASSHYFHRPLSRHLNDRNGSVSAGQMSESDRPIAVSCVDELMSRMLPHFVRLGSRAQSQWTSTGGCVPTLQLHHRGLLSLCANEENMTFRLTLILSSALMLMSTECSKYDGNIKRVPLVTLTTT